MGLFKKKLDIRQRIRPQRKSEKKVFSYYQNRADELDTPKSQRNDSSSSFLHKLPGYIAALVIFCSFAYSLTLTTNPKVIIVNDQEQAVQAFLRSHETYEEIAQAALKSPLSRTKLTINTTKIAEDLKPLIPEATDVSITLPLVGRNPVVYIRIAEPALVLDNETGRSYVVDEQGRAVTEGANLQENLELIKVTDKTGVHVNIGEFVLPADHIEFIKQIEYQLNNAKVSIQMLVLPQRPNEVHVYIKKSKYYAKYNILEDVKEQVGRHLALEKYIRSKNITPKQYIDVRVPDRAYIR